MPSKYPDLDCMISVDVETAGPNPAEYTLLAIGACNLCESRRHFYVNLKPDKPEQDTRAMSIHGLNFADLQQNGIHPQGALRQFEVWLEANVSDGQTPLFVGFNASFDWMFLIVNNFFYEKLNALPEIQEYMHTFDEPHHKDE